MKYDPAFIDAIKRYIKAFRISDAFGGLNESALLEIKKAEAHLDSFGGEE